MCLALAAATSLTHVLPAADPVLGAMPKELRVMPPQIARTAAEIQEIVDRQRGLVEKARQAKTPAEREAVFQAVADNVQLIAKKRVAALEQYVQRARARVEWAKRHASEVCPADLVVGQAFPPDLARAMEESAGGRTPRSPFESDAARRADAPASRQKLPEAVVKARDKLEQSMRQLESLAQKAKEARSDRERDEIGREIGGHWRTIEQERIAILEAILQLAEKRLAEARRRAGTWQENGGQEDTQPLKQE
jgi:hypothetical protein